MFVERLRGEILTGEFDFSLTKNKDMPSTHRRRILDGARALGLWQVSRLFTHAPMPLDDGCGWQPAAG
jgi:hypothetical protein